jgi:hypothetical protein
VSDFSIGAGPGYSDEKYEPRDERAALRRRPRQEPLPVDFAAALRKVEKGLEDNHEGKPST